MRRDLMLLGMAVAVIVCALVVPDPIAVVPLVILWFAAGVLVPEHPVAVGSLLAVCVGGASVLVLVPSGALWLADEWHNVFPLTLNKLLATLIVIGNVAVRYLTVWGWAVFLGYMGAGVELRRQLRAGVQPPAGAS